MVSDMHRCLPPPSSSTRCHDMQSSFPANVYVLRGPAEASFSSCLKLSGFLKSFPEGVGKDDPSAPKSRGRRHTFLTPSSAWGHQGCYPAH